MTKEPAVRREIKNADFIVETSTLGCAADDRRFYDRLARQLHRMTAHPRYGRAWVPWTSFHEMAATPDPRRRDVLGVVLNLYRELRDRFLLTGTFQETIKAEWSDPPHNVSRSFSAFESDLVACSRTNGRGTFIDELGEDFRAWRIDRRLEYEEHNEDLTRAFMEREELPRSIALVLERPWTTEAYDVSDDIAGQVIERFAERDREEGVQKAKANPEAYRTTWTHAFLYRLAQFAQTIPTEQRAKGRFGRYAKLMKGHRNDFIDAELVSLGSRCGFLITQDGDLRERLDYLFNRGIVRIQAFDFDFIEGAWTEPVVRED
ncbi:MAG: hypothetical protein ABR567_10715 [Myxococcales bacterium]|nr:hypothetical protein [Myxococcales bacterium]